MVSLIMTRNVKAFLRDREPFTFIRRLGGTTGMLGLILLIFWAVISIVGPAIVPYSATELHVDVAYSPPSLGHMLGTDQYGRDMLSRIIIGSRSILTTALGIAILSLVAGIFIGFTAGYVGGFVDEVIMRFMDMFMSIPSLLLAMVMLGIVIKPGIWSVMLIIAIVYSPRTARVARSTLLEYKSREFVDAARIRGESALYIMFGEVFPNCLGPLIVEGTARFAYGIMTIASLGFLGVGLRPPTPDWGLMIAENKDLLLQAPWTVIFPAAAVASLVIGASLFTEFVDRYIRRV